MMNNNGDQIKRKIIQILEKHPEGLTVKTLSEILNLHRQTVTKYIFELKGAGVIYRRRVGSATLHYLVEIPGEFVENDKRERMVEIVK